MVDLRSKPKDELRRERLSKWPERFSRRVAWRAKPESCRDSGVVGSGGKDTEVGERDGGGLSFVVELVVGRWSLNLEKALKTSGRGAKFEALSPKDVELRPANLARQVDDGVAENRDGDSEENVSNGKVSAAYAGGPGRTP
jgi:hypothetical protein